MRLCNLQTQPTRLIRNREACDMQAPGTWEPVFGGRDGRAGGLKLEGWEEGTYSDSIVIFNIEVVVIVVVESVVVAVVFVGHSCCL
jgi:hypothetical protein